MEVAYRRAVELLEADINDELVALEPKNGHCFGFNAVATTVWRKLESPRTFAQLESALLSEYDIDEATCSVELKELLEQMVADGLVAAG